MESQRIVISRPKTLLCQLGDNQMCLERDHLFSPALNNVIIKGLQPSLFSAASSPVDDSSYSSSDGENDQSPDSLDEMGGSSCSSSGRNSPVGHKPPALVCRAPGIKCREDSGNSSGYDSGRTTPFQEVPKRKRKLSKRRELFSAILLASQNEQRSEEQSCRVHFPPRQQSSREERIDSDTSDEELDHQIARNNAENNTEKANSNKISEDEECSDDEEIAAEEPPAEQKVDGPRVDFEAETLALNTTPIIQLTEVPVSAGLSFVTVSDKLRLVFEFVGQARQLQGKSRTFQLQGTSALSQRSWKMQYKPLHAETTSHMNLASWTTTPDALRTTLYHRDRQPDTLSTLQRWKMK